MPPSTPPHHHRLSIVALGRSKEWTSIEETKVSNISVIKCQNTRASQTSDRGETVEEMRDLKVNN